MSRPRTIEERRKVKYCKYCNRTARYIDEENNEYLCKETKEECRDWYLHEDIPNQKCSYCNDAPAISYFSTARKYCCATSWNKCIHFRDNLRKKALERTKDCNAAIKRKQAKSGEKLCKYCGRVANYWKHPDNFCCVKLGRDCPGYHDWLSKVMTQRYKDRPELIEMQRRIGLEVHNRAEVKEKKRETMTLLHNGDCEECVSFQENYAEGRDKWRKTIEEGK